MSDSKLSIVVIDEDPVRAAILMDGLAEAGHAEVALIDDVNNLLKKIFAIDPDVNAFSRLQSELSAAKTALSERKIIKRAKGILMQTRGMSEEEAYAALRKTAMNEKKRIVDIASSLVTADRIAS